MQAPRSGVAAQRVGIWRPSSMIDTDSILRRFYQVAGFVVVHPRPATPASRLHCVDCPLARGRTLCWWVLQSIPPDPFGVASYKYSFILDVLICAILRPNTLRRPLMCRTSRRSYLHRLPPQLPRVNFSTSELHCAAIYCILSSYCGSLSRRYNKSLVQE